MNTLYKKLSEWEESVLLNFASEIAMSSKNMEELLCTFYFRHSEGRALIIQAKDQYCVLFLSPETFDDAERRKQEVDRFFELMGLIRLLKTEGYISLYRGANSYNKVMHFLQDDFRAVQPNNTKMILNSRGDYTAAPDTIHDKSGKVIYKGIVFDNDYFQMISNNVTGQLYIFPRVSEAFQDLENRTQTAASQISDRNSSVIHKKQGSIMWVAIISLLFLLGLSVFLSFRSLQFGAAIQGRFDSADIKMRSLADDAKIEVSDNLGAGVQPTEDKENLYGIDISHWNGNIMQDIHRVDSLSFAICKATEGEGGVDADFRKNWNLIKRKNLVRGAYHFFRTEEDPIAQAIHFYKTISLAGLDSLDMPLIVDIEESSFGKESLIKKDRIEQALLDCMGQLEKLSKRRPMIYTNLSFANKYLRNTAFAKYPLWLADYTKKAPQGAGAWKNGWKIWQRSSSVHINSYVVDYDVYYGTKEGLYR